jgi:hypothetical protein
MKRAPDAYKIESNIPPPEVGKHNVKYPWKKLKIGDSFLVKHPCASIPSQASTIGPRIGMKFVTRSSPEGVRVWRVE